VTRDTRSALTLPEPENLTPAYSFTTERRFRDPNDDTTSSHLGGWFSLQQKREQLNSNKNNKNSSEESSLDAIEKALATAAMQEREAEARMAHAKALAKAKSDGVVRAGGPNAVLAGAAAATAPSMTDATTAEAEATTKATTEATGKAPSMQAAPLSPNAAALAAAQEHIHWAAAASDGSLKKKRSTGTKADRLHERLQAKSDGSSGGGGGKNSKRKTLQDRYVEYCEKQRVNMLYPPSFHWKFHAAHRRFDRNAGPRVQFPTALRFEEFHPRNIVLKEHKRKKHAKRVRRRADALGLERYAFSLRACTAEARAAALRARKQRRVQHATDVAERRIATVNQNAQRLLALKYSEQNKRERAIQAEYERRHLQRVQQWAALTVLIARAAHCAKIATSSSSMRQLGVMPASTRRTLSRARRKWKLLVWRRRRWYALIRVQRFARRCLVRLRERKKRSSAAIILRFFGLLGSTNGLYLHVGSFRSKIVRLQRWWRRYRPVRHARAKIVYALFNRVVSTSYKPLLQFGDMCAQLFAAQQHARQRKSQRTQASYMRATHSTPSPDRSSRHSSSGSGSNFLGGGSGGKHHHHQRGPSIVVVDAYTQDIIEGGVIDDLYAHLGMSMNDLKQLAALRDSVRRVEKKVDKLFPHPTRHPHERISNPVYKAMRALHIRDSVQQRLLQVVYKEMQREMRRALYRQRLFHDNDVKEDNNNSNAADHHGGFYRSDAFARVSWHRLLRRSKAACWVYSSIELSLDRSM
jgi:hypothetical protein